MKLIDISTKKHPETFAMVDDRDFEYLNQWKWSPRAGRNGIIYAQRMPTGSSKTISMHRFLIEPPPGTLTDHRDGNGLNNQRSNLRVCNNSKNAQNSAKHLILSSIYKGVFYCNTKKKFRAGILVNGRNKYLGLFDCEINAARTYNDAAIKYFGEFARPNDLSLSVDTLYVLLADRIGRISP